jgi:hypothetical protein
MCYNLLCCKCVRGLLNNGLNRNGFTTYKIYKHRRPPRNIEKLTNELENKEKYPFEELDK